MKNWDLRYSLSIFMILFHCGCSYKGSHYFRQIAVGCKQRRRFYMKRGNVYFETTKSYCGCSFKRKPSAYILKFERRACSKFKTVWKHLRLRESAALFKHLLKTNQNFYTVQLQNFSKAQMILIRIVHLKWNHIYLHVLSHGVTVSCFLAPDTRLKQTLKWFY